MRWMGIWKIAAAGALAVTMMAPAAMKAQGGDAVLKPADVQKLLPEKVYYSGQSANTQLRNSGGVKLADGHYILSTLVDTSGYATGIAAKYQAYFITEVAIKVGGKSLPAGIYGVGMIAGGKLVVTDVGGHDVLTVSASEDAAMKRPMPLQITTDPAGGFRLYLQRSFVVLNK